MGKNKKKKSGFGQTLKRMFFGQNPAEEMSVLEEEQIQSPFHTVLRNKQTDYDRNCCFSVYFSVLFDSAVLFSGGFVFPGPDSAECKTGIFLYECTETVGRKRKTD